MDSFISKDVGGIQARNYGVDSDMKFLNEAEARLMSKILKTKTLSYTYHFHVHSQLLNGGL